MKILTVIGARPQFIKAAAVQQTDPDYMPFGDGKAAEKIMIEMEKELP